MDQSGTTAWIQVTRALREMVLATPFETSSALPAEPALMQRFGVSRGTLRRATEELEREGLLLIERGRGTTIRRQVQLRMTMRDVLTSIAVPDSRWHLDVLKFVPDFEGSDLAHRRVRELPSYGAAGTLFIAPDNSLSGLIAAALDDGKRVVVPTYGMRRGMVLLEPARVAPADRIFASTLDGLERLGQPLDLDALRSLAAVDVLVTGGIAFTTSGVHVGSGDAYLQLEWALLAELGLVGAGTAVIGLGHPQQIVDHPLDPGDNDITVNTIVTPGAVVHLDSPHPRPAGIPWSQLTAAQLESVPYLEQLRPTNEWTLSHGFRAAPRNRPASAGLHRN